MKFKDKPSAVMAAACLAAISGYPDAYHHLYQVLYGKKK